MESGDWTAVIMNADASNGVTAEVAFGAATSNIDPIAWTMVTVGLIALIGGGFLLFRGLRRRDRDSTSLPVDVPNEQSASKTESLEKRPTTTS